MGFATYDAYINAITSGQRAGITANRTIQTSATSAAGRWHECLSQAGTGGAMTLTGTAGTGIVMSSATTGSIPIGADVSPATRHLTSMTVYTPGTTVVPGMVLLTDIIHIYPSLVVVTPTPSTLSNHPTWTGSGDTRMTNARGVQASMLLTTASSAAGQMTLTYVDQDNNTAQAQTGSLFGVVAAHPGGCLLAQTPVSATVGGPVMALGAGDTGVRQVSSYAVNVSATAGTGCIVLHRPIAYVPLLAANTPTVYDFTTGPNAFPRIYDGACLGMFVLAGGALAASQVVVADLQWAWG